MNLCHSNTQKRPELQNRLRFEVKGDERLGSEKENCKENDEKCLLKVWRERTTKVHLIGEDQDIEPLWRGALQSANFF